MNMTMFKETTVSESNKAKNYIFIYKIKLSIIYFINWDEKYLKYI